MVGEGRQRLPLRPNPAARLYCGPRVVRRVGPPLDCPAMSNPAFLPHRCLARALPAAIGLAVFPIAGVAQSADPPVLRAGAVNGSLRIDGRLAEPDWLTADSISSLTEVEPVEGGPAPARTVVRVLASSDAIVIGVVAMDPDPSAITAFAVQRDARLENEDHISFVLDPFQDGRSGYVFAVNPKGARFDALVANGGEGVNSDWDAIWEAATERNGVGWTAEIRIPVQSLIFREGVSTWGFNIERRIQRLLHTSRWASPSRDIRIMQTSRAGRLEGLPRFGLGAGLGVRPSFSGGFDRPDPDASQARTGDVSLDVFQRVSSNLLASATFNTDFAETEVDTRRTNLTRFPLFFPEKRTFFLEGADVFDFGIGLSNTYRTEMAPFFSRRIGLYEGNEIPIVAGGKLNGRVGRTGLGALVVRTDEVHDVTPAATMGVVRLKQSVLSESSAGVLATFGDPLGGESWMAGADLTYQTSRFRGDKNFLLGVWGLALGGTRTATDGDRTAFGAKIDYPNDLVDAAFTYKRLGDAFSPPLGFVPRNGVHSYSLGVNWSPRPAWELVRQMVHELRASLYTDLSGSWESYRVFLAPINWRMESGDRYEFNWVPQGEQLVEEFEVADSVFVAAGAYHFTRWRLEAQLAAKRRLSGMVTWWFGDFYDGSLHQIQLRGQWNPSPLLTLELNAERNIGDLPGGEFTVDLVGTRVQGNFSPDLQLSSFVQYDNESGSIGTNSRLRWTFHPQGELFVVYNHNLQEFGDRWDFDSNQLIAKVQYLMRW